MSTALIVSLTIIAVYLAIRWHDANVEIGALREQIASLKRQLTKRPRP
jgi:hypothetical protein